jgi:hypothetical protein
VIGVPARVGYADVRNHMTSRRLRERTKSKDRGTFPDVPFETIQADFRLTHPSLVSERGLKGDFRAEATTASRD